MSSEKLWKNNKPKRSNFLSVFAVFFILFSGTFFARLVSAGTLSCSVTTVAACTGGTNKVIWRMSGATNAHAEMPSQTTAAYDNNVVCCNGITGLDNLCSGTFATALKLSGATNAHVQQSGTYAQSACISVPSGGAVSIGYQATDCSTPTLYDTTLGSMKATTNSHVGNATAYTEYKICGTASGASASLSFVVNTNNFSTINSGSPVFATSTLSVDTTNSTGWNVMVSRSDPTATMALVANTAVKITDQTAWVPGAATTTVGNALRIASLINSQKALAFRVMTASGTPSFISTSWWGSTDAYTDNATSLWAGFGSTDQKIGNSSISSGGSPKLNTVLYYLDVPLTQQSGAYSGGITYTATMNP